MSARKRPNSKGPNAFNAAVRLVSQGACTLPEHTLDESGTKAVPKTREDKKTRAPG